MRGLVPRRDVGILLAAADAEEPVHGVKCISLWDVCNSSISQRQIHTQLSSVLSML